MDSTPQDRLSGPHGPSHETAGLDAIRFLDTSVITTGTLDLARIPGLDTGRIPDLPASKITSGTFALARIPVLDTGRIPDLPASKITSGVLGLARIPAHGPTHEDGGSDELDISGLTGGYSILDLMTDHPILSGVYLHDPKVHGPTHEAGGTDVVTLATAVHGADKHTDVTREFRLELFPYTAAGGDLHTMGAFGAYAFENNATGMCYLKGKVPDNFVSFIDCNVIWLGSGDTAGQDWRMRVRLLYSAVDEAYGLHAEAPSDQIIDVTVLEKKYATDPGFSFTDLAIGDMVYVQVQRKGLEGDDTYDGRIYIDYVLIRYTAEQ